MGRLALAFKAFFQILSHSDTATRVQQALIGVDASPPAAPTAPSHPPRAPAPTVITRRSDALTLLEVLQREGRLIDFLQEGIDEYSDQQVGSAVREVHRACRATLERLFAIVPVREEVEGTRLTLTEEDSTGRYRLTGKVIATRPASGTLVHGGWQAKRCDMPQWTGAADAERVLAPAEVEMT